MATLDASSKERLLQEFRASRGNKKIGDLEEIARAFNCTWKVTKSNHQNFIPPYRELEIVNVARPHNNDVVLAKYLGRFIRMLEDILELTEEKNKGELP